MMEIIRLILATILIAGGVFIFGVVTVGIYRLKYCLNRIHVTAKCDTLATLLTLSGLIILEGLTFTSVKLFLLIVFMWLTGPVAVHLIGQTEILTNPDIEKEFEVHENDMY